MIIGSQGRVGQGAVSFCKALNLEVTEWTRKQTKSQGPFRDLLKFDILVNAIRLDKCNVILFFHFSFLISILIFFLKLPL